MSVYPRLSSTTPRIEPVTVSPIASDAEMIVVDSINPTTMRVVCARRRGMFLTASFTSIRLRNPRNATTLRTMMSIAASTLESTSMSAPKNSFIGLPRRFRRARFR